ncbi:hypothetical protein BDW74DRAFT_73311 [Aspergillus multicolor]|uniref:uncharacterized protein n=1 Tax=Aspergillus multicolor TaxID=41759 RepID=UPI003CCD463B
MPYSDLPVEIVLNVASFFDLKFDNLYGSWGRTGAHPDIQLFIDWIQTSKWFASVLTTILYDHAFELTPARRTAVRESDL